MYISLNWLFQSFTDSKDQGDIFKKLLARVLLFFVHSRVGKYLNKGYLITSLAETLTSLLITSYFIGLATLEENCCHMFSIRNYLMIDPIFLKVYTYAWYL